MLLSWIGANIGTILVCILLAIVVFAIIRNMIKDKRKGKSPICGGKCAHCAMGCGGCGGCGKSR
jgi:cell division protein FtsW (lipid II flippase)